MAVANKLAILQKIKREKGVLFGSLSSDLTKQNKCEKWKEVNELAESLDWLWQYFATVCGRGGSSFLGASSLYNF